MRHLSRCRVKQGCIPARGVSTETLFHTNGAGLWLPQDEGGVRQGRFLLRSAPTAAGRTSGVSPPDFKFLPPVRWCWQAPACFQFSSCWRAVPGASCETCPIPLFMRWRPELIRIFSDQPASGSATPACRRCRFAFAMTATDLSSFGEPSSGNWPAPGGALQMSHDLAVAQQHAFQLARILMVPVTLFKSGSEYGVLPSNELDADDDLDVINEFDPHIFRPAH